MQSCYGRLESDLVWSMSQDHTVSLEVGTTCLKVRQSGSLIVLTKDGRACMQSCYGRLGSDLV